MQAKLLEELQAIITAYESVISDTASTHHFEDTVQDCQAAINGLVFTERDYQNPEIYETMLLLKKMHQAVYEKSQAIALELKEKHQLVRVSAKQILKYRD